MALDRNNSDIAYLLGRVLAVIERAEQVLNRGRKGIVERQIEVAGTGIGRFFGLLYGRFVRGFTPRLHQELAEIMDKVPSEAFPQRLSLEQFTTLQTGFYHQRKALSLAKEETADLGASMQF